MRSSLPAEFSRHARTLSEQYRLDGSYFHLKLREASPLAGAPARTIDLSGFPGLAIIRTKDQAAIPLGEEAPLPVGASLVVAGPPDVVAAFAQAHDLAMVD